MSHHYPVPTPQNEPILNYAPGSPERAAIVAELARQSVTPTDILPVVAGTHLDTGRTKEIRAPHRLSLQLASLQLGGAKEAESAADAAIEAGREWANWRFEDRAAIFLKAADLLAGAWRQRINAATMLGQSKTVYQAEIDAACELIDFLRFNVSFAEQIYAQQPLSPSGVWNHVDYRPLEGFVYAVTPFNFTSIGGNLATAPAIMGNTVVWKPATSAVLSNYLFMQLLEEAGLPPGVINFLPGDAAEITETLLRRRELAGFHFTGSTAVFNSVWRQIGQHIESYASYPRIVGETGGKDFVLAHPSADVETLAVALVRGAFEYQGQKCSAASRAYIPGSLWPDVKKRLAVTIDDITMGDVASLENFMSALIDRNAFERVRQSLDEARASSEAKIIIGGECRDDTGYFIRPTVIEVSNPKYKSMQEEIFGPVLSIFVYQDNAWPDVLRLVDETSAYALTGSVFAQDRRAIAEALSSLRYAAGNFYVNDKPTGAVVGQQPFGGSRASGTNDKAGSMMNLLRWTSARTVKETFVPPRSYKYPHMSP